MFKWLLVLLLCVSTHSANAQMRVASINMCADQLLLLMAARENIVSLSYLSADSQYSGWTAQAQKFPLNYAGAEEIVTLEPDLVLAGQYSDPMVIRLLRQQGIDVYQMTRPQYLEQLFDEALAVGQLLDREDVAKRLIDSWQRDIARLIAQGNSGLKPRLAIVGPNGFTEGAGSLRDQMLQQAGIINIAAELGLVGNSAFTLEQLIVSRPDLIALEDSTRNVHSLAQRLLQHPAIGNLPTMAVELPANMWSCPGPSYVQALGALIEAKLSWQARQDNVIEQ